MGQPTGHLPEHLLTAHLPRPWPVDIGQLTAAVARGRRLVVLDDDPTGTQAITDLPVLTSWSIDDLRWAIQQSTAGFFVLTNSRSLAPADAALRNREIVRALAVAGREEAVAWSLVSRSDSTLRGHYPLETDVLTEELAALGVGVDGVIIVPAYLEPGRITIDSLHWARTSRGMLPVGSSESARDATFGYRRSDLREWVEEKTAGRVVAGDVVAVTIDDLRVGGPDRVYRVLSEAKGCQVVVADAAVEDDLRVLVAALLRVEADGKVFVVRSGPSFIRARVGQPAADPVNVARLRAVGAVATPDAADARPRSPRGLIVVGSHVGLTTRQLDRLRADGAVAELELDVSELLDPRRRGLAVERVAAAAVARLIDPAGTVDVVVRTSRTLVTGSDAAESLAIARRVSAASVEVVTRVIAAVRPRFVIAKGGITSADTATGGLGIRHAWVRGCMLPGIVALWEPVDGPAAGIPYVVFAGNVGDDTALAAVRRSLIKP